MEGRHPLTSREHPCCAVESTTSWVPADGGQDAVILVAPLKACSEMPRWLHCGDKLAHACRMLRVLWPRHTSYEAGSLCAGSRTAGQALAVTTAGALRKLLDFLWLWHPWEPLRVAMQFCKDPIYQWTSKCTKCEGSGYARSFSSRKSGKGKSYSACKCITCCGIGTAPAAAAPERHRGRFERQGMQLPGSQPFI